MVGNKRQLRVVGLTCLLFGFATGVLAGVFLVRGGRWEDLLYTTFKETLRVYGPFALLSVLLPFVMLAVGSYNYSRTIELLRDQIDKISANRDQLQDVILKRRISSRPEDKEP
jgi:hypothetical protein